MSGIIGNHNGNYVENLAKMRIFRRMARSKLRQFWQKACRRQDCQMGHFKFQVEDKYIYHKGTKKSGVNTEKGKYINNRQVAKRIPRNTKTELNTGQHKKYYSTKILMRWFEFSNLCTQLIGVNLLVVW
ncbi:MAG: hypothetical protein LCI00_09120 [Chloroflexi bacterium]|nr:hypothetical protein [Chloroflexota bacterium]MCC6893116.1 hypothetical protein [Anaerolineae bacterium]